MKKIMVTLMAVILVTLISFAVTGDLASANTGYDLDKVRQTSENVDAESIGKMAKGSSIPIMVTIIVIAAFVALVGIFFKKARAFAATMIGMVVIFFLLVNFAPEIAGILIGVVGNVMETLTGGA